MQKNDIHAEIPTTIYSLWLQGRDQAPPLAQLCFKKWQELNPDYRLIVLEQKDLGEIRDLFLIDIDRIPAQALSDIVRTFYLLKHGGIWVDASLLPMRGLSSWIDPLREPGFFAFEKPGPDRPIASWFLIASKGHLIIAKWWEQVLRYWSEPRELLANPDGGLVPSNPIQEVMPGNAKLSGTYPYFWFHYLFDYLLRADNEFAECWSHCSKISAKEPHELQNGFRSTDQLTLERIRKLASKAPVQKLTFDREYPVRHLDRLIDCEINS